MVSATLPLLVMVCVYVTEPPGNVCCVLLGVRFTLFSALTVTASRLTSVTATLVAEVTVKSRLNVPGAALPDEACGTVTSAQTRRLAPALIVPVEVRLAPTVEQLFAPPSARKATDQPAGVPATDRLKLSFTAPVLFTYSWKRVMVEPVGEGVTVLVETT